MKHYFSIYPTIVRTFLQATLRESNTASQEIHYQQRCHWEHHQTDSQRPRVITGFTLAPKGPMTLTLPATRVMSGWPG